jgi:uncharacterized protein (DUF58 family)
MASPSDILHAEDIAPLHHLQLFARGVMEGVTNGLHASPHKGFSVEFRQHRPYVQGDEIRRLDWKIFGRSDRFYIREYEEETNLRATIVLDGSGSMGYKGQKGIEKFDYARKLAASLAYLLISQQDAVGLLTFDAKMRDYLPPRSRANHLHQLLEVMVNTQPGEETGLASVLELLPTRVKRRGLLILISDLFDDAAALLKAVGVLRKQGHELIVFQIWDRDELDFPFSRWSKFENLENGEDFIMLDPPAIRNGYLKVLQEYRDTLRDGLRKHEVDLVPMVTDEPHAETLRKYLSLRMRK